MLEHEEAGADSDDKTVIKVLTSKSIDEMIAEEGVGDWRGDASRMARMEYVICVRNARASDAPHDVPHGTAFWIGKVVGVRQVEDGRVRIVVGSAAELEADHMWRGSQNPVRYITRALAEKQLGRPLSQLVFKPVRRIVAATASASGSSSATATGATVVKSLTIPEAKAGLAKTLGIDESKIEIIIHV